MSMPGNDLPHDIPQLRRCVGTGFLPSASFSWLFMDGHEKSPVGGRVLEVCWKIVGKNGFPNRTRIGQWESAPCPDLG